MKYVKALGQTDYFDLYSLKQNFTIPAQQLPATYRVTTIIEGKIVYQTAESMRLSK